MDEEKNFLESINATLNIDRDYINQKFDYEWLEKVEEVVPYIDNILRNPKRFIINEEEVVKVELARRTTVESIIHLTQHTNFIQDYDKKTGDVKPSKVLNINRDESLDTYENRFVYTLLGNLELFFNERVEQSGDKSHFSDKKVIKYTGNAKVGTENININIDINSFDKSEEEVKSATGESFAERVAKVKVQLDGFKASELYRTLHRLHVPPVRSPIRKTNVILKNPNFQKAEELWNYIQLFESKDKKEASKSNYYDDGVVKQDYDSVFLMLYNYNKLISTEKPNTKFERKIAEMSEAFINNILDSSETINEEDLKEIFIKKIDKIKDDNKKKYAYIFDVFEDRLSREDDKFSNLLKYMEKED